MLRPCDNRVDYFIGAGANTLCHQWIASWTPASLSTLKLVEWAGEQLKGHLERQ